MTLGGLRSFTARHRVLVGALSIALACLAAAAAISTAGMAVSRLRAYVQHEARGPLFEAPPWVLGGLIWLTALLAWGNRLAGEDAALPARDTPRAVGVTAVVAILVNSLSLLGFVLTAFATEPIQVKGITGLSYALATLGAALVATGLAILGRALLQGPKETAAV